MIEIAQNDYFLVMKCTKGVSGWGSAPGPAGGAYSVPQTPLLVGGLSGRGRGGESLDFWPYRGPPSRKFLATGLKRGQRVIAQVHSVEWVQRDRRAAETAGPCEWWQLSWNLFCDEREASAIQTEQAWYNQSETFGPRTYNACKGILNKL